MRQIDKKLSKSTLTMTPLVLPNRGRDIWPFCFVMCENEHKEYQRVLKIHSKKGYYEADKLIASLGDTWREYAFDCLFKLAKYHPDIVSCIGPKSEVAMAGPRHIYVSTADCRMENWHEMNDLLENLPDLTKAQWSFFAGSMFWINPAILSPILPSTSKPELYKAGPGASNGEMMHYVERLFGFLANQSPHAVVTCDISSSLSTDVHIQFDSPSSRENIGQFLRKLENEW